MKSLSVRLGVILATGVIIFGYAEVWGADWRFVLKTSNYFFYYDAQSISRSSKNVVKVWVKMELTEKGLTDMVEKYKNAENLSFMVALEEINCSAKKSHYLSLIYYSKEGEVILTEPNEPEWIYIPPDSVWEVLHKAVCK